MQKMTLMQHFRELKRRAAWSVLFFLAAFAGGFYAAPAMQRLIMAPLLSVWGDAMMIYTGIQDSLTIQISLAGLFALALSLPFLLYQLWAYVRPALKPNEKKIALPLLFMSPVLFLSGAAFAYFFLLPLMFGFFISIGSDSVSLLPNAKNYLSFSIGMLEAFGFAFQLPLVLVLLNRAGVLSKRQILSATRYIIVGIFVLSAVLTPPDVISQIALSLPLVVLFGLSFLFMV
jgi:sec-independent protein translocase protein TatC